MKHCRNPAGIAVAVAGIFIILAIVLPTTFWWFMLGILLLGTGICIIRKR